METLSNSEKLRSKSNSPDRKHQGKRVYIKFSQFTIDQLNELYKKRPYPTKKEMKKLSNNTNQSIKKLENWFKHKRRKEMKNGNLTFSKKKIFSTEDKKYLMKKFKQNKNPTYSEYKTMSKQINCPIKNLKNWFCYKRKLFSKKSTDNSLISTHQTENFMKKNDSKSLNIQTKIEVENSNILLKKEEEKQPEIKIEASNPILSLNRPINHNYGIQQSTNLFSVMPNVSFPNFFFPMFLNQNQTHNFGSYSQYPFPNQNCFNRRFW